MDNVEILCFSVSPFVKIGVISLTRFFTAKYANPTVTYAPFTTHEQPFDMREVHGYEDVMATEDAVYKLKLKIDVVAM